MCEIFVDAEASRAAIPKKVYFLKVKKNLRRDRSASVTLHTPLAALSGQVVRTQTHGVCSYAISLERCTCDKKVLQKSVVSI